MANLIFQELMEILLSLVNILKDQNIKNLSDFFRNYLDEKNFVTIKKSCNREEYFQKLVDNYLENFLP